MISWRWRNRWDRRLLSSSSHGWKGSSNWRSTGERRADFRRKSLPCMLAATEWGADSAVNWTRRRMPRPGRGRLAEWPGQGRAPARSAPRGGGGGLGGGGRGRPGPFGAGGGREWENGEGEGGFLREWGKANAR